MNNRRFHVAAWLCSAFVLGEWTTANAADRFWTNSAGGNFTNHSNWNGGVPAAADDAHFTNNASYTVTWSSDVNNANAFINSRLGTITLEIDSFSWLLTNSFVIGQFADSTGTVTHAQGNLLVTNATGTATLVVGEAGRGALTLSGGTLTADRLLATNVLASANSVLTLNHGALTTSQGATIKVASNLNFIIGNSAGQTATWNISGGTNQILFSSTGGINLGQAAGGSGAVVVSGPNTVWTNSAAITVGNSGAGSQLVVSDGARVFHGANSAVGNNAAASNSLVRVTGGDSLWKINANLHVGLSAASNHLHILDGGRVENALARVGVNTSSSNNLITVDGSDSLWSSASGMRFNENSAGNRLVITNGGRVVAAGGTTIGFSAGGSNGWVEVIGSGSLWSNGAFTVGSVAGGHNVTIADGGVFINAAGILGNNGGDNRLVVDGNSSLWSNTTLTVGSSSTGNEMVVSNGGRVVGTSAIIGSAASAGGNTARISGSDSAWELTSTLTVGHSGASNQLYVTDGGRVISTAGFLGHNVAGSVGNLALVSGTDSIWEISGELRVGTTSTGNRLIVTNGGRVFTGAGGFNGIIGVSAGADDNEALVAGDGSVWTNVHLTIGRLGHGNRLTIADGAQVLNGAGTLGQRSGSNNVVVVTGSGSIWNNTGNLLVGERSSGNELWVTNGATVLVGASLHVGSLTNDNGAASSGFVRITGRDSLVRVDSIVSVGTNAITRGVGHLLVSDGGTLEANTIVSGLNGSGSISNAGGVYQFTTANPGITNNTAGSIAVTDGTISFRGINNALVDGNLTGTRLTHVSFAGNNTFQLNNATNTPVDSYAFDSVVNTGDARNYQRLALRDNSRWQSDNLTIGTDGELVGNGTVASASVTNHGVIAPGFSAGALTFTSNLVLGTSSVLRMEIGGAAASAYDQLIVFGNILLTGGLWVGVIDGFSPTPGDTFTLIDNLGAGLISGEFDGLTNNAFLDASANGLDAYFRIQYNAGDGNDLVLIAVVPEPGAGLLVLLVAALFWSRAGRRREP